MTKEGWLLRVIVHRWVRGDSPGWVEARFTDAAWRTWAVIERAPVLTGSNLLENSQFPQIGHIACEILSERQDSRGRPISEISTERPNYIRSVEGVSKFIVLTSQLVKIQ